MTAQKTQSTENSAAPLAGKDKAHAIDIAVGKSLRQIRKRHGESQTTLGDIIGVTFQQVQKYERGTNRLSAGALCVIADHYSVTPDYFFANVLQQENLVSERERLKAYIDHADDDVVEALLTLVYK